MGKTTKTNSLRDVLGDRPYLIASDKIDGQKMKALRIDRGLTISQLAMVSGVRIPVIVRLEYNIAKYIFEETIIKLAKAFGMTPIEYLNAITKEKALKERR